MTTPNQPQPDAGADFQRENRYLVIKRTDADAFLTQFERATMNSMEHCMASRRESHGKPPLECLVIESDWPEYEPTWAAIKARMNAATPSPVASPDSGKEVEGLRARLDRVSKLLGTLRTETHAVQGHDDPGAVEDCWREVFDELVQIEEHLTATPHEGSRDGEDGKGMIAWLENMVTVYERLDGPTMGDDREKFRNYASAYRSALTAYKNRSAAMHSAQPGKGT